MVLVALVVLLQLFPLVTGQPPREETPAWVGVVSTLLALAQGVPLLWRHAHPAAALVCVQAGYAGTAVVVGLVPPVAGWVLIWSLASGGADKAGSMRLAAVATLSTGVLIVIAELARPGAGASLVLLLITLVVAMTALLLRSERTRVANSREQAAAQERLRIARDLHDLVGHGLSAIAVQSSTARVALDQGDTEAARTAVTAVESSSRTAMREMRQMLGVLVDVGRERQSLPDSPAPRIADISTLAANLEAADVPVTVTIHGPVDGLPATVQLTVYRVVQEALTNALKHSPGAPVTVEVRAEQGTLRLTVTTIGGKVKVDKRESGGLGLSGSLARVEAMGGEFRAGATPDGWSVEARLPLSDREDA